MSSPRMSIRHLQRLPNEWTGGGGRSLGWNVSFSADSLVHLDQVRRSSLRSRSSLDRNLLLCSLTKRDVKRRVWMNCRNWNDKLNNIVDRRSKTKTPRSIVTRTFPRGVFVNNSMCSFRGEIGSFERKNTSPVNDRWKEQWKTFGTSSCNIERRPLSC